MTGEVSILGANEKIVDVHTNGTIKITTIRKELGSDTVPAGGRREQYSRVDYFLHHFGHCAWETAREGKTFGGFLLLLE